MATDLETTSGPLARALLDADVQVCGAALRDLVRRGATRAEVPSLLEVHDRSARPFVRGGILKAIAALDAPAADLAALRERVAAERDGRAHEDGTAALARLGDADARAELVRMLHASAGPDRERLLAQGAWIGQPWLLPALIPVLDDATPLAWIGVDGRPDLTPYLRACDIAAELSAAIPGRRFSFPMDGVTNYAPGQLEEVRAYLRGLADLSPAGA